MHEIGTFSYHRAILAYFRVLVAPKEGNIGAADSWVRRLGMNLEAALASDDETEQLTVARVLIAQGALTEVAPLLGRMAAATAVEHQGLNRLNVHILQARAAWEAGAHEQALTEITQALTLAVPEGVIRSFADVGPPLAPLLHAARSHGIYPAYCDQLLAALPSQGKPAA